MFLLHCATICLTLFHIGLQEPIATSTLAGLGNNETIPSSSNTFLYFAYGSNMLKERLQLRNPSASFVTTGRLKNHTIRFGHWTNNFNKTNSWHGGVATIERSEGEDVWGVIWRIGMENLISLDKQEGVKNGIYRPLEVVCLGAIQHGLPQDYIQNLEAVQTNGYSGPSILDKIKNLKSPENKGPV